MMCLVLADDENTSSYILFPGHHDLCPSKRGQGLALSPRGGGTLRRHLLTLHCGSSSQKVRLALAPVVIDAVFNCTVHVRKPDKVSKSSGCYLTLSWCPNAGSFSSLPLSLPAGSSSSVVYLLSSRFDFLCLMLAERSGMLGIAPEKKLILHSWLVVIFT